MKQYGIDQLQIDKFISTELILQDETIKSHLDSVKDINEINKLDGEISSEKLKILKEQNAEAVKYADTLQKSISTNLLDSMQNKKGTPGLFASMTDTVHKQFQSPIADNTSKLVMSTGIGDVSSGFFTAMNDVTRTITDPILQAHIDGGAAVHDAILSAYGLATHQDFSGYMRAGNIPGAGSSGVASMTSSPGGVTSPGAHAFSSGYDNSGNPVSYDSKGNVIASNSSSSGGWDFTKSGNQTKQAGIWGNSFFSNHYVGGTTKPYFPGWDGVTTDEQGNPIDANGNMIQQSGTTNTGGMSIGEMGAIGTAAAGGSLMIAGGFNQIAGGGAKNITGGIGSVAGGLGGAIIGTTAAVGAATAAGVAAGTTTAAAAAGTAGALNAWNPVGWTLLAAAAVLEIVSLFMKSNNSSTSVQTTETKVASKIDVSNQKLELINRNLLALNNTLATYALATSSYFSEKNGAIDSQFALGAARSIY